MTKKFMENKMFWEKLNSTKMGKRGMFQFTKKRNGVLMRNKKKKWVGRAGQMWLYEGGGKNPKNVWWNNVVKAAVQRKNPAWKKVM